MARETKEIRKRLSGPEAAPYMGLARKLLGELKEGMAFAKLLQNERTVKLSDGTMISVSSRFGQDEVRIEKPIFVPVVEEEERKEVHEPYLWIGVRVETGGMYTVYGQDYLAGSLHLSVWEPGFDLEHPEKSADADLLSNRYEGETNKEVYPLQDSLTATVGMYTVFRSRSNLLCFSDWAGEQYRKDPAKEELFDVVVVGDMDDLLETGFKWDPLYGNYTVKVCFVADECEEPTPVDFRLRICVGRDERSIVYDEVHHIDEASQYRFMYLPYGWFGQIYSPSDCFSTPSDNGKNPHGLNWWQEGARVSVPWNERQGVSIEQGLRPVGFEGGQNIPKGRRCPQVNTFYARLPDIGTLQHISSTILYWIGGGDGYMRRYWHRYVTYYETYVLLYAPQLVIDEVVAISIAAPNGMTLPITVRINNQYIDGGQVWGSDVLLGDFPDSASMETIVNAGGFTVTDWDGQQRYNNVSVYQKTMMVKVMFLPDGTAEYLGITEFDKQVFSHEHGSTGYYEDQTTADGCRKKTYLYYDLITSSWVVDESFTPAS